MLYKFKSKAGSDVIMMGPNGDELLQLMGRSPAPKGILEAAFLPGAIMALEDAVAADEARRLGDSTESEGAEADSDAAQESVAPSASASASARVSLRQRAWPLLELMQRSQREGHDIVWGI